MFNLLEEFHGEAVYDQNVVSYLELLRVPYTGCNPRGLMLARGKDLSKKLVHYHRMPVPAFAVFPMGRKVKRPPRLALPLIVKSLSEDASMGIAQASVVDSDEKLAERVAFIHERIGTAAIAEQYIEGREIYVGVLGNDRLRVLPIWELQFGDLAAGHAADRHREGQARHRIPAAPRRPGRAGQGPGARSSRARIKRMVKRICRTLELDGYARIDFRLAADGTPYFIEANPNPEIAKIEEFARRPSTTGSNIPSCSTASSRSACGAPRRWGRAEERRCRSSAGEGGLSTATQCSVVPPETSRQAPVMWRRRRDSRNATARPTSSPEVARPSGLRVASRLGASSSAPRRCRARSC